MEHDERRGGVVYRSRRAEVSSGKNSPYSRRDLKHQRQHQRQQPSPLTPPSFTPPPAPLPPPPPFTPEPRRRRKEENREELEDQRKLKTALLNPESSWPSLESASGYSEVCHNYTNRGENTEPLAINEIILGPSPPPPRAQIHRQ